MTALFMTMPAMANEYGGQAPRRDNYVGVRLHKNDNLAFGVEPENGDGFKVRDDSFGFGLIVGNRLTDFLKLEFETEYTYANKSKNGNDYNFDVWSNMLNVYLYKQFGGAVEPYAGLGVGVSGIWGSVYQNYGDLEMTDAAGNHYNIEVDGTEFYIGAAYKFGL